MSILTTFFNLIKPEKGDRYKVSDFDENFDIIDAEMHKPPLSVNGVYPTPATRDISLNKVPLADNLASDDTQAAFGDFVDRMSGGDASIKDGNAMLVYVKGNSVKTGYIPEELSATSSNEDLTVSIDRATFVSQVDTSTTLVFSYASGWDTDPATYGITVTGTPENGDTITVIYVKGSLGTITNAEPTSFNATGWNLYDNAVGYARVLKYSTEYGYFITGAYTAVQFAETIDGEKTTIVPVSGFFNVPADGYLFVTGGNNTTTEVFATWSDWIETHPNYERYNVDQIDLSEIMVNFPFGLASVGAVRDEINFSTHTATSNIARVENTAENLATVIASGAAYDMDEDYIYYVKATPDTYAIEDETGAYVVSEHGIEFFSGTTVPCYTEILYGQDLKNKLIRDVVTISEMELTAAQKTQVQNNIGAKDVVPSVLSSFLTVESKVAADNLSVAASSSEDVTYSVAKTGYTPIGIVGFNFANATSGGTGRSLVYLCKLYLSGTTATISVRNATSTNAKVKLTIYVLYRKNLS